MKKILILLTAGLLCRAAAEPMPFPEKLKVGTTRNETGNIEVQGTWQAFKDMPVTGRHRYLVTIRARVKKGTSIETQPVMKEFLEHSIWKAKTTKNGMPWDVPVIAFEYRSGDKRLWAMYHSAACPVFSQEFRDYKFDFYAFDTADAVRFFVRPQAPENTIEIASAEITEVDMEKEPYLNANCDLSFGLYNPSGWGYANNAVFGSDQNGPYIDVGPSWAVCDAIPVTPGERLKISFRGEPAKGKPYMSFVTSFFESPQWSKDRLKNKLPMRATAQKNEGSGEVVVPEGRTWMRLSFGGGAMRWIKVEKVKEEKETK